jgi:hypothetical protein
MNLRIRRWHGNSLILLETANETFAFGKAKRKHLGRKWNSIVVRHSLSVVLIEPPFTVAIPHCKHQIQRVIFFIQQRRKSLGELCDVPQIQSPIAASATLVRLGFQFRDKDSKWLWVVIDNTT